MTRERIEKDHGPAGKGAGEHHGGVHFLTRTMRWMKAEVRWIETDGMQFTLNGKIITPGSTRILVYRLPNPPAK